MTDTKILSSKTVFTSKYFEVIRKTIKRNGNVFTKDFIQKNDRVVIIPYTSNNEIYMELQYRDALNQTILELVAGNMESNDTDPLDAAKRELYEETGLTANKWKKLHVWQLSANLNSKIHLFIATDLKEGEQHLDADEKITVMKIPLDEILKKINNEEMIISYQIAGILLFDRLRKEGKV